MEGTSSLVQAGDSLLLKQQLSSLVDAIRFSHRSTDTKLRVAQIEEERDGRLHQLDGLTGAIEGVVKSSAEAVGPAITSELATQIAGFCVVAIDQAKRKVQEEYSGHLKEQSAAAESDKEKALKSIEGFLATSPFQVLERLIRVTFAEAAYSAKCSYRCVEDLQYDFSLDTKKSPLFGNEFRLAEFQKELRLPIGLSKNWLKREPIPEYEKLDQYLLTNAEATENSLIATFTRVGNMSSANIVYSRRDSHSFLSVKYKDKMREVEVTKEADLNKFLDSDTLQECMERIWLALKELEAGKIGLIALKSRGKDVLEQPEDSDFFGKAWRVIAGKVTLALKKSQSKSKNMVPSANADSEIDEAFVREKAALLGDGSKAILDLFSLK